MEFTITQRLLRLFGISPGDPEPDYVPSSDRALEELRHRYQSLKAMNSEEELVGFHRWEQNKETIRYRLELKFRMEFPVPVVLELTKVTQDDVWTLNIVKDDTDPS